MDGKLPEGINKLIVYGAEPSTTPKLNVSTHLMLYDGASFNVIVPIITNFPVLISIFLICISSVLSQGFSPFES